MTIQTSVPLAGVPGIRDGLQTFDFQPTTRVTFGTGSLEKLGSAARDLNATRVLLVTDPGLIDAGHAPRAVALLRASGLDAFVFSEVEENPTTAHVRRGVTFAEKQGGIDLIIALGGGSAMDCAKGINFLLSNGGKMEDYWGKDKATKPMLPSIGIPTTAGTGSEAQRFALISHEETHRKMACGDIKARFRTVILDPALLVSVPHAVAAHAGMDAVTHAVESYVTSARNGYSRVFAREAWVRLERGLERALSDSDDVDAWGQMMLGAHFAGAAIENSMLGAAHACANPLTARYGVIHGIAVALMLPHVIRFNNDSVGHLYEELAEIAHLTGPGDAATRLAKRVSALRTAAEMPGRLRECDVDPDHFTELAEDAATQWTGTFNPKPLTVPDFIALYRAAY